MRFDQPPADLPDDRGNEIVAILPYLGDLTVDEIHAAYLGTCGLLVALAYETGLPNEALGFTLTVFGLAFGVRVLPTDLEVPGASRFRQTSNPALILLTLVPFVLETAAARVVRREPWYFVVLYLVTFLAGLGLSRLLVTAP